MSTASRGHGRFFVVELRRFKKTPRGTFGALIVWDYPVAVTLEPPWINNKRNKSCIPDGTYIAERHESKRWGKTFKIKNVFGRDGIILHPGNLSSDTRGCVLVGQYFGRLKGLPAVMNSRVAFRQFMRTMEDRKAFPLKVSQFN